jgi:hypothetical protein
VMDLDSGKVSGLHPLREVAINLERLPSMLTALKKHMRRLLLIEGEEVLEMIEAEL